MSEIPNGSKIIFEIMIYLVYTSVIGSGTLNVGRLTAGKTVLMRLRWLGWAHNPSFPVRFRGALIIAEEACVESCRRLDSSVQAIVLNCYHRVGNKFAEFNSLPSAPIL